MRTALEVADIFRAAGPCYRAAHAGHLSLMQLKVMTAIENCRTAALGGHVEACEDCGHWRIAYNSCRNRHCPKCQGAAARTWLAAREADLLPVGYFHVVFTLPAEVADIAWQNKAAVYDLLFRAASETMLTIAADPKHLGARIGITAVLHTWGSAMTHHPHVHMIVPGGGIAPDGSRWISSRPAFLLPVRVLGALFRRLFLTRLIQLHDAGRLAFFGGAAHLADRRMAEQDLDDPHIDPILEQMGGEAVAQRVRPDPLGDAGHARLVDEWVSTVGLDRHEYGTHSLRRTKASLIYKATGNLRAVQILLGHTNIENTVRYLGVDIDDALTLSERTEI